MKGLLIVCDVCECREPCSDTTDEAMPPGWRRAWSRSRLTRDNQRYPELVDIYGRKPLTRLTLCPLCQSGAPMSEAVKSLVAAALTALDAVVLEEMKAEDPGKYARITRILKGAADLKALYARSMKDVLGEDGDDAEDGEGLGLYNIAGRGRPRLYGGGDQVDMQREMMMLVQKQVDSQIEANKPKAKDPVRALEDLMAVKERYNKQGEGCPLWLAAAVGRAEASAEAALELEPEGPEPAPTPSEPSLVQSGRTSCVTGKAACPPPPPGYAPCTRGAPHEGPCAMPLDHVYEAPRSEIARAAGLSACVHRSGVRETGVCSMPERLHPTQAEVLARAAVEGASVARAAELVRADAALTRLDDADRSAKAPRNDIFDGAVHEG